MIPIPHDSLDTHGSTPAGGAAARPRWRPGEDVDGWVTAEITPYPRPLISLSAPFEAQFVLAVVEYPSGPAAKWGRLRWRAVDIVLRAEHSWPVVIGRDDAPELTPDLQKSIDDLTRQALALGWEPAGRGRTWCSLRFRRHYADLCGQLQWR
jgi:hypothetical protein